MNRWQKFFVVLVFGAFSLSALAAGNVVRLTPAKIDTNNIESIKRGAKFFATNCMVCHAMRHLEHDKLSQEAGITIDKMPLKDQDWWFGVAPPDLSLVARVRSPDWIYTYLHSFYKDEAQKLGSNNLLVPGSRMPNPFGGMQGVQMLMVNADKLKKTNSIYAKKPSYFTMLHEERQGSMTPTEFHDNINDLVNYLVYAAEPIEHERKSLGWWVLGFMLIMIILTFLLNREYWRNIEF